MAYSYDSEPTTSYTRDSSTSEFLWDDADLLWDDANVFWGGIGAYSYDSELSTSYTNDTL